MSSRQNSCLREETQAKNKNIASLRYTAQDPHTRWEQYDRHSMILLVKTVLIDHLENGMI